MVARWCPRRAVSAPGPRGERRARSSPDLGTRSPVSFRGCSRGRFCVRCLGKVETHCLPAAVLRGAGDCKARLGCLSPPAEKPVLSHRWPLEPKGSSGQLTDLPRVPRDDDG